MRFYRNAYAFNNPLKYTDPSGHCPRHDDECEELQAQTEDHYKIKLSGNYWTKELISSFQDYMEVIANNVGGLGILQNFWGGVEFTVVARGVSLQERCAADFGPPACAVGGGSIYVSADLFGFARLDGISTLAHELGHILDARTEIWDFSNQDWSGPGGLWRLMAQATGGHWSDCTYEDCHGRYYKWNLGPGNQLLGSYARSAAWEDWATAFQLWVVPQATRAENTYTPAQWNDRLQFVDEMMYRFQHGENWWRRH